MSRFQSIYDIAELCAQKEVTQAFLCPGSRCAPLTLAFVRHANMVCRTFPDERSAGFIALGAAQQTGRPSIFLCTSGTAALNVAPAVAEAFFSETPLIIFTADRPAEWIAQHDGQTIHQQNVFGRHVKGSWQLPQDYDHPDSHWAINRMVNEAINLAQEFPRGPVHINAPFREPLYPARGEEITFSSALRVMHDNNNAFLISEEQKKSIRERWPAYHHVLVVAGQQPYHEAIAESIREFIQQHPVPVVGDVISNLHAIENVVRHADNFLGQAPKEIQKRLQPDLLITFGQSVISKNLKLFLRHHQPKAHWHIQPAGVVADPFQHITEVMRITPESLFNFLGSLPKGTGFESQKQNNYQKLWEVEERRAVRVIEDFFPQPEMAELELVHAVLDRLPENTNLHLANSMSVRYANAIGLKASAKGIRVFANRGTSGIDGCSSTTVGHRLTSDAPHVLITGDLAFFYDRNAFWHNYPVGDLHVILLNNHGGVIFNMIDGPSELPESAEFFVTAQKLSARHLCAEFGFEHLLLDNRRKIKNLLKDITTFEGKTKILEFESGSVINKNTFDLFKQKIKQSYAV